MKRNDKRAPQILSLTEAPRCKLLGVDFSVLLPRESSEAMEVLLERYPQGHSVPVHRHKECEQFYFLLEGEAEVRVGEKLQKIKATSAVYIPRHTDHSVKNVGEGELVYLVFETYPEGYLPEERTWDSHVQTLRKIYGE